MKKCVKLVISKNFQCP